MNRNCCAQPFAALCLLICLLLSGCVGDDSERCGYMVPKDRGLEASGLVVGVDMEQGGFYSFPILDVLRKVLPQDMPLYFAAFDSGGVLQLWDRDELEALESHSNLSDALGHSNLEPEVLTDQILARMGELELGDFPLVTVLTEQQDADLGDQYQTAAELGVQLQLCHVGDCKTSSQAAAATVAVLRDIGPMLSLQVVALSSNPAHGVAFTLPQLGTERMAMLVQGTYRTLTYQDNDITSAQKRKAFQYSDESMLQVVGYQTDHPGTGNYVLGGMGKGSAAWLCLRHAVDVDWQLWPETGTYITAGQPMQLQVRLMKDGKLVVLPKGVTATCELTVDDAASSLPMEAQTDRFYQLRSRKLVSSSFVVPENSRYSMALHVEYPDFGELVFLHNWGYGLTMGNFAPQPRWDNTLYWSMGNQKTLTPDELFIDPEGGSVTLQQAQGEGGIHARLTEDGSLYLEADNPLYATGLVTLLANDDSQGSDQQTVPVRYTLLPWWTVYLILGGMCAIWFADALCKDEKQLGDQIFFCVMALVLGAIWPVSAGLYGIVRVISWIADVRERHKRRKEKRTASRKEQRARARQEHQEREQQQARAQQEHQERAQEQREQNNREAIQELKRQVRTEKSSVMQMQERMKRIADRLRRNLDMLEWIDAVEPLSCAAIYLREHPHAAQVLAAYPRQDAAQAADALDAWVKQIDSILPLRYDADSESSLKEALSSLCSLKRALSDDIDAQLQGLELDGSVRVLYEKFHAKPDGAELPVLVKVFAPGRTELMYLGVGENTGRGCRLEEIRMSGLSNEADTRLGDLSETVQGCYLLPASWKGRRGYEIVSENTVFLDRNNVSQQPVTFLLPGRQYQLRGTSIVVEIKPPIE